MGAITSTNVSNGKPNLVIIDEIDGASATGGDCVINYIFMMNFIK